MFAEPFGLCTPHPTRYQYPLIRYLGVDDPIGKLGKWFISCWISSSGAWFPPAIINWLWSSFLLLIELSSGVSIVLFLREKKSRYNRVLYAQKFHDSIYIIDFTFLYLSSAYYTAPKSFWSRFWKFIHL